jgi:hypothetical protein
MLESTLYKMTNYYYLAVQKKSPASEELSIRIDPKGFLSYTYYFRTQKFYASRLTYTQAKFYKFISPLFSFKNDSGEVTDYKQLGKIVICKF